MRPSIAALVLLLTLVLAGPAGAQSSTVDRVAEELRSDPVYVDPAATTLSSGEAQRVRSQIEQGHAGPVYVAVLPGTAVDEAGGSPEQLTTDIRTAVGRSGTYIVVAGNHLRATSNVVQVSDIADQAVQRHGNDGLAAILTAMVSDIAAERSGGPASGGSGGSGGGGGAPGGAGGLILLGAIAVGGGAFMFARSRRRRREEAEELEHVKDQVRDDLVSLGDGIRSLDLDVEMPNVTPEARADYERAVSAYERANTAWTNARRLDDLQPVGAALEEGRWSLESARARLEGRTPPQRTAPCFFDPRHGPSSREVEWAPPGGTPRPVPACEADAQRVERGVDPAFREVESGGRLVPYWSAGPAYSPFYSGGMFGGFGGGLAGGLLGGMLLGEMFDGPDVVYADPGWGGDGGWGDGGDGGDWDGGGGWDSGGGDFGGGGGDFGGGDFGGGDMGGGDF